MGDSDFTVMKKLDADGKLLKASSGDIATRDM